MNKTVFAGKISTDNERSSKCVEIIVPAESAKIKCADGEFNLCLGQVAVIPPFCKYSFAGAGLSVLIEQALLPLKGVQILADDDNSGIRHSAEQAEYYFNSSYAKKEAMLAALGELLISYVIIKQGEEQSYSPVVELVRADIEKNLSDAVYSLEDFIKKLPLNYDYVRKLFKKETGVTPHEYLLHKRMELASDLILSGISNKYSGYSISQIAEACGYAEPLYFSRVFKKYYGVAPSEYQKR